MVVEGSRAPRSQRPGGALARRPLHFFWLLDCSGSMRADGKIQALNQAVYETIPALRDVAGSNPQAEILVRALTFSSGARWHVAEPTPVDELQWSDVNADGRTDLGAALTELAKQLEAPPMESRSLPPAIVLLSDGQPTDTTWKSALDSLDATPWGRKAVRLAIAIGRDADRQVLQRFIGDPELKPLPAHHAEQLVHVLKWASTVAVGQASRPVGRQLPEPPVIIDSDLSDVVTW